MNDVRLVIRDASRDINGECELYFAEAVVSALSAEPETIDELISAMARFQNPREQSCFHDYADGINDEPLETEVVIVDLAGKYVAYQLGEFELLTDGCIGHLDDPEDAKRGVRFHIPPDFTLVPGIEDWRLRAAARRRERDGQSALDVRAVLYGPSLLVFIATECHRLPVAPLPVRAPDDEPSDRNYDSDHPDRDVVHAIHARWMMTPRDDLRGAAPRDVMLAKRGFIGWDLQDRSEQWTAFEKCPPGLGVETHAYRYGGFGTHECVVYYDIVRFLLWSCRNRVREQTTHQVANANCLTTGDFVAGEVQFLKQLRDEYLEAPEREYSGRTPREVIENERRRIPEGGPAHEHIVDHDCPLCQMMADMPGPMFWGLDGSHLDDDFAFSFHRTQEEYDEEIRERADFHRKYEETRAEEKRLGVEQPPGGGYASPDYIWERSFVAKDGADFPAMRLFAIGSRLAELTYDLKHPTEERNLIDQLSRDFGNLREVTQSGEFGEALVEPVVAKFCETLDAVAAARSDLVKKCVSLQSDLKRFWETPSEFDPESGNEWDAGGGPDGNPYFDDGLPF